MSDSMDGTPLAQDNRTLISNLDRLHTTVMGTERIKRNLNIETDAVAYCKALILKRNCVIYQQGKNWYCGVGCVSPFMPEATRSSPHIQKGQRPMDRNEE